MQEERAGWQRLGAAAVAAAGGAEAARGSRSARAVVALAAPRCCRRVADVAENAAAAWIVWSLPTEAALPCALQSADAEGARGVALGIVAKDLDDGVMLLGADGFLCCRAGCGGEGENGAGGGSVTAEQRAAGQRAKRPRLKPSLLELSDRRTGRDAYLERSPGRLPAEPGVCAGAAREGGAVASERADHRAVLLAMPPLVTGRIEDKREIRFCEKAERMSAAAQGVPDDGAAGLPRWGRE